ncbi:phosphoadenosine phosphosulfate reductase [Fertoebacter nigrum]|uniref:Phosphoadenosine phosphosulfate reductase n=1 Tax=Fertoeibacter niger TaxID=2656921 RepID=A0A8X8GW27_9RHOB|nr:phosphoadenosine phosphosulfate reductase [Fertoeibacter niger]NUB42958.1 phosphoadenosine phosphosulfate reductase [Fertoeibacter niger]
MSVDVPVSPAAAPDAAGATDRDSWLALMDDIGEEAGYFQPLGDAHWAFFSDQSPVLLVTFESLAAIRATPGQMPAGHAIAAAKGWSHLCLIAEGDTWYRDAAVYRYFDRLVDDAFFEDFDRVVFYGSGMGGYAACAYSVTAPGATVLALQPRATLDPAVAGWDRRDMAKRRLSFTDRYGFAPDMTEGTGEVFVLHDPAQPLDAMHAALFTKPYVTQLRCRHLTRRADLPQALTQMNILSQLIEAACEGRMSAPLFHSLWRGRRQYGPYLRTLWALTEGRPAREIMVCRSVSQRLNAPRFRKRLAELESAAAAGPATSSATL